MFSEDCYDQDNGTTYMKDDGRMVVLGKIQPTGSSDEGFFSGLYETEIEPQ